MKKLLSIALVAMTALFLSCSSDGDGGSSSGPSGNITANLDGEAWASMNGGAVVSVQDNSGFGGGLMLQIMGMRLSDNSSITIQFPIDNLAEGTYNFSGWDAPGILSVMQGMTGMYSSAEDGGSFTLTITDLNIQTGKLSGTFSGTLVDFDGETTMSVTNGQINNVMIVGSSFHSNGTMSLSRNGGAAFTMDDNDDDGKFVMLSENTVNDDFAIMGYNTTVGADFGIYTVGFPKDITPGTYTLTDDGEIFAGIGNSENQAEFQLTSGTMTITSHNGTNVIGTFSFNVSNGSQNVSITNGAFNVNHN